MKLTEKELNAITEAFESEKAAIICIIDNNDSFACISKGEKMRIIGMVESERAILRAQIIGAYTGTKRQEDKK